MEFWSAFLVTLWVTLCFSILAIPFAFIPAGATKLILLASKHEWLVPANGVRAERKVSFFRLALLGGIAGEFVAVSSDFIGGDWWCSRPRPGGMVCNLAQDGVQLIFTIPILAIFGGAVAIAWTWLSLRLPPKVLGVCIMAYSGRYTHLNWLVGVLIVLVFWSMIWLGMYWVQWEWR